MSSTILTNAGRYFYFDHPEAHPYEIEEIAHALSHLCRYTGHVSQFYSVAQHSVMVSKLVPQQDRLVGLLHDASEAFLGDVASPLKRLLPDYKAIEQRVERAIAKRFDLEYPFPESVKKADLIMLVTEKRDLLRPHCRADALHWPNNIHPLPAVIRPMSSRQAFVYFMDQYERLTCATA